MGIPKLTAYMKNNGHFSLVTLRQVASKLVIDGYALCYALHCGIKCGDYYEFYDRIVEFFKQLKSIGVEAYVVVDGIDYENRKEEEVRNRLNDRLKLLMRMESQRDQLVGSESFLPSLAKVVFVDALRENGIKFFVADGEADRDIASLANHLHCPVFCRDSDFFIFNIECGVILMPDHPEDMFESKEIEIFEYQKFVSKCKFASSQILLFLPYCLGNDFHPRHELPELQISSDADVSFVVQQLGTDVSFNENYQQKIKSYFEFYEVAPQSFDYLSCNSMFSKSPFVIPPWIVSRFKQGEFSRDSMYFLVSSESRVWKYVLMFEDLSKESAWAVTDSIMKFVIGALLSCNSCERVIVPSVCVVSRKESTIELEESDISDHLESKHFDKVKMAWKIPIMERKKIISDVFQCKSRKLNDIPEDLQLVIVASRCWLRRIHKTKPVDKAFIVALVLCIQKCYNKDRFERRQYSKNEMSDLDRIHYLAQWECMFHLANIFNQILKYPFPCTSLGRLFSASRFQDYFVKFPEPVFVKLDDTGRKMYNVIVKDILPEALFFQPRQAIPSQPEISLENRFDSLASQK